LQQIGFAFQLHASAITTGFVRAKFSCARSCAREIDSAARPFAFGA
jgi:hypothetical protein